jgi:hypothetical protein
MMTKPIYQFEVSIGLILLTVTAKDVTQSDDTVWYSPKPTLVRIEIHEGERRIYQTVVGMARSWDVSTAKEGAEFVMQMLFAKAQLEEVQ